MRPEVETQALFWARVPCSVEHARVKRGHILGRGTCIWKSSRAIRATTVVQGKFAWILLQPLHYFSIQMPAVGIKTYKNRLWVQNIGLDWRHNGEGQRDAYCCFFDMSLSARLWSVSCLHVSMIWRVCLRVATTLRHFFNPLLLNACRPNSFVIVSPLGEQL